MKNEIENVSIDTVDGVTKEIYDAFFDIPFENSTFQTETFVLSAQITPERAYRQLGLRLTAKLRALNSAKYGNMKTLIDIEEKMEKINDPKIDKYEKERLKIEVLELKDNAIYTEKLVNDAIIECNTLYDLFKKFPRYTREQFERAEENHFLERSKRQIVGIEGGRESMYNILHDKKEFFNVLNLLENSNEEDFMKLTLSMKNKIEIQEEDK